MGSNTVWLIALFCAIVLPAITVTPALAAAPVEIVATSVQTETTPFSFAPYEIGESEYEIIPDFASVDFINKVGSAFLTLFSILERLDFIPLLVVLILTIKAIWWLYSLVVSRRQADTVPGEDTEDDRPEKEDEEPVVLEGNPYRKR